MAQKYDNIGFLNSRSEEIQINFKQKSMNQTQKIKWDDAQFFAYFLIFRYKY